MILKWHHLKIITSSALCISNDIDYGFGERETPPVVPALQVGCRSPDLPIAKSVRQLQLIKAGHHATARLSKCTANDRRMDRLVWSR